MPLVNLRRLVLVLVTLLGLVAEPVAAANWPRFRGPNGTGLAADKDIPVKFEDQNILWKVPLPGIGNCSPIVWNDRLFLQTSTLDGKERFLLCLDTATGKTVWSKSIPGKKAHTHVKNTLASATPTTDGEAVYLPFWDGEAVIMTAVNFQGEPLWSRNLGSWTSQHGPGHSPILFQDKLIYVNDMDGLATLFALDKKTGKTVWQVPREAYRSSYCTPFFLEWPGAPPELIVSSTTSVDSYNPADGSINWKWHWKFTGKMPLRSIASPIVVDGTLFVQSGDGGGDRHACGIHLHGPAGLAKPTTAWENKKDFPYVSCLLSRNGHAFFVNDRGFAGCVYPGTGKQVWFERLGDALNFTSSPVLIDGKIYAASEEGDVYVWAADTRFQLLAKNSLGERFRATPAVADNRLYLRGQYHLFCIGKTP